ncbi:uncharacterized protein KY384_000513 [Bacidia gigantensis]|uniref:uncharacterized protein n=1 Tax=Bacidia gigantensis TaxID=2732470 RepID=UPI001D045DE4|nr:uncharacterized protein KY384_000513 [Bacidia gigantensis]KAG8525753.1 hypothetical protein KY384_000513 [Bacidia gigantensis]
MASLAFALGLLWSKANAVPFGGGMGNCYSPGNPVKQYDVTNTAKNWQGDPVVGDWSCVGTGGTCNMATQQSYSVAVTVEVGFDLGLDFEKIAGSAGISASVSTTTETGTTQGISKNCPDGPWSCALIIWPAVTKIEGIQTPLTALCTVETENAKPYTVQMPEVGPDGLVGGHVDVCACKNFAHWADPGAPSIVCPQDCKN